VRRHRHRPRHCRRGARSDLGRGPPPVVAERDQGRAPVGSSSSRWPRSQTSATPPLLVTRKRSRHRSRRSSRSFTSRPAPARGFSRQAGCGARQDGRRVRAEKLCERLHRRVARPILSAENLGNRALRHPESLPQCTRIAVEALVANVAENRPDSLGMLVAQTWSTCSSCHRIDNSAGGTGGAASCGLAVAVAQRRYQGALVEVYRSKHA